MSEKELTSDQLLTITRELRKLKLLTDVDKRPAGFKTWFLSVEQRFGSEGADFAAMLLEIERGQAEMPGLGDLAMGHMRAARPLHIIIVVVFGVIALACIIGGGYAIYRNSQSPTEFSLLGAKLSTGHVGVAFVGIGIVCAFFTVRSVLKNLLDLAALPRDQPRKGAEKQADEPK